MLISDKYQFVFVHIPKCAGTFIRSHLRPFAETEHFYHIKMHPDLGKVNFSHIPLSILEKHFRNDYEKILNYWSFAIVRDPSSRFVSSFAQYLKEFKGLKLFKLGKKDIENSLDEVITKLIQHDDSELLPLELIHFQKQHSYIFSQEVQVVKQLYRNSDFGNLFGDLNRHTGTPITPKMVDASNKMNETPLFFKNKLLRKIVEAPRPLKGRIFKHLPVGTQAILKKALFAPKEKMEETIMRPVFVRQFVRDYYKMDFKLLAGLT